MFGLETSNQSVIGTCHLSMSAIWLLLGTQTAHPLRCLSTDLNRSPKMTKNTTTSFLEIYLVLILHIRSQKDPITCLLHGSRQGPVPKFQAPEARDAMRIHAMRGEYLTPGEHEWISIGHLRSILNCTQRMSLRAQTHGFYMESMEECEIQSS
jgi:hypothetical protein